MYSATALKNEGEETDRRYAAKVREAMDEKRAGLQVQRQAALVAQLQKDLDSMQHQVR